MESQEPGGLDLRDYLGVLRRRRWIVVGATAAVVLAAVLASLAQTKIYRSTAEILLQPRTSEAFFSPGDGGQASSTGVSTEIQVMRSRSVHEAVTERLGFQPRVTISPRGDTQVIAVSAEDPDPARAANAANTFAETYIELRRERLLEDFLAITDELQSKITDLDREIADLEEPATELDGEIDDADTIAERERLEALQEQVRQDAAAQRQSLQNQRSAYGQQLNQLELAGNLTRTGGAQLVSDAEVPSSPVRPTPVRSAIVAAIVGLVLGFGLAFVRDHLDDTIRAKDDLEAATGRLTVLGLIPTVPGWKERKEAQVVAMTAPASPAAEAYRSLRTSIQFLGVDRPLKLIQVTSANATEGKTTTIANLAVALAGAGERVVVVCCDLRRPRLHEFFGASNDVGFTSVLVGASTLGSALQQVQGEPRIALLASGPIPPNPSELLSSSRSKELFQTLAERADVVLIDSPPLLPVTDGLVLAGIVDATIYVASSHRTTRKAAHRAIELLQQVNAPIVGSVLNGVRSDSGGYGYGYGYGSGYGYGTREKQPQPPKRLSRRARRRAASTDPVDEAATL